MTKFYDDNNKLLEITMTDDCTGASWEYDFFDVGALPFNAELGAYKVKDVEYLADYAKTYADGTNTDIDYSTDGDGNILPRKQAFPTPLPTCKQKEGAGR